MEAEVLRLFKVATDAMSDPLSDLKIKCLVDVCAGMDALRDAVVAVIRQPSVTPRRTEVFVGDKLVMFYPDRLTQVKVGQLFHVGQTPYTVLKVDISDNGVKILCGETTTSSFLGSRMETVV